MEPYSRISTLMVLLCVLLLSADPAAAVVCGTLAAVKEKVEVLRLQPGAGQAKENSEAVRYAMVGKNFMPLECDDVIQTNQVGSAKLLLGDDKITIAPDTRIVIAAHSLGQTRGSAKTKVDLLNLTYGKMRGLIKSRPNLEPSSNSNSNSNSNSTKSPKGAFRVKTYSAVVGVRGTDLFASYDPNAGITEQAVIEGRVEVVQAGTRQRVIVEAGQQVTVETTPAAIEAARKARQSSDELSVGPAHEMGAEMGTPPPEVTSQVKPLKVIAIQESLKKDMRVASAIAKDDREFAAPAAVSVLGQPQTWTIEREDIPSKLKKLENEF